MLEKGVAVATARAPSAAASSDRDHHTNEIPPTSTEKHWATSRDATQGNKSGETRIPQSRVRAAAITQTALQCLLAWAVSSAMLATIWRLSGDDGLKGLAHKFPICRLDRPSENRDGPRSSTQCHLRLGCGELIALLAILESAHWCLAFELLWGIRAASQWRGRRLAWVALGATFGVAATGLLLKVQDPVSLLSVVVPLVLDVTIAVCLAVDVLGLGAWMTRQPALDGKLIECGLKN